MGVGSLRWDDCAFCPSERYAIRRFISAPAKAKREMGWQTKLGIDRMCEDSWRWQSMNPDGFEG